MAVDTITTVTIITIIAVVVTAAGCSSSSSATISTTVHQQCHSIHYYALQLRRQLCQFTKAKQPAYAALSRQITQVQLMLCTCSFTV
jgi:hypothetical protein